MLDINIYHYHTGLPGNHRNRGSSGQRSDSAQRGDCGDGGGQRSDSGCQEGHSRYQTAGSGSQRSQHNAQGNYSGPGRRDRSSRGEMRWKIVCHTSIVIACDVLS